MISIRDQSDKVTVTTRDGVGRRERYECERYRSDSPVLIPPQSGLSADVREALRDAGYRIAGERDAGAASGEPAAARPAGQRALDAYAADSDSDSGVPDGGAGDDDEQDEEYRQADTLRPVRAPAARGGDAR